MKKGHRIAVLRIAQALGFFALARRLTRGEARILCYHGFSYRDEHAFAPQLFMRPATFVQRLEQIAAGGFHVITLQELVQRLRARQSLSNTLVMTVDDGWTGFARFALPELQRRGWPVTLYLTTYYATKRRPVLNVLRQYLQWKKAALPPQAQADAQEHQNLLHASRTAGVDLRCQDGGLFELASPESLRTLCAQGLDLQLHTHRHRYPEADDLLAQEIDTNRRIVQELSQRPANHLCFPSGQYRRASFALLEQMQIQSATTTHLGLVNHRSDPMELPRLLDGENLHPVEFAAELSGFASLVRRLRSRP